LARSISLILVLLLCFAAFKSAEATFTVVPTADITPTVSLAKADDVTYIFHLEDHDPTEVPKNISIIIPAGYTLNPKYITDMPGLDVGEIKFFIDLEDPWADVSLALYVRTTDTPRVFGAYLEEPFSYDALVHIEPGQLGNGTIVPPTPNAHGKLTCTFNQTIIDLLKMPKKYGVFIYQAVDFFLLPGVLINPSRPGHYTWRGFVVGAERDSPPQEVNPRPGYTLTVEIVAPVGGIIISSKEASCFIPFIILELVTLSIIAIGAILDRKRMMKNLES